MSNTFTKPKADDVGRIYSCTLIQNGDESTFFVRDYNGVELDHLKFVGPYVEAMTRWNDYVPPQSEALNFDGGEE